MPTLRLLSRVICTSLIFEAFLNIHVDQAWSAKNSVSRSPRRALVVQGTVPLRLYLTCRHPFHGTGSMRPPYPKLQIDCYPFGVEPEEMS